MEQHVNNVRDYLNGNIELLKETRNCIYFDNGSHMKLKTFHQVRAIIRTDTKRESIVLSLVKKSYSLRQEVISARQEVKALEKDTELIDIENKRKQALLDNNYTNLEIICNKINRKYPVQIMKSMYKPRLIIYIDDYIELQKLCLKYNLSIKKTFMMHSSFISATVELPY
tara:strand:+ start:157 stop:666 length:510 start_codon:yes stop_codon:yes gene_type:complete